MAIKSVLDDGYTGKDYISNVEKVSQKASDVPKLKNLQVKKPTTPEKPTTPKTKTIYVNNGNAYAKLAKYYQDQNEKARQDALSALAERLKAQEGIYNGYMDQTNEAYQGLINQSEVSRYKNRASLREALSNRGQLDSGLGRQEALYTSTQGANQTYGILRDRENARQDIRNSIAQLKASGEEEKANINNAYNESALRWVESQKK